MPSKALTRHHGLVLLTCVGLLFPAFSHAAKPGTTTPTVTLTERDTLNFETVAGSADGPSTITLSPTGAVSTTGYAIVIKDRFSVGEFLVKGPDNANVLITLPTTVTISNGGSQATLTNFTSSPSGVGTLSSRGKLTITVGATLTIPAGQAAGDYTGPMTIFVDLQ